MGASLLTYMVFGPRELDETKKEKAILRAKKVKSIASKRLEGKKLTKEEQKLLSKALDGREEEYELPFIASLVPHQVVESLIDVWNGNKGRDVNSRPVPGEPDMCITVAGDMSWGDEPEGLGYTTLKSAQFLGLFEIFELQ